MESLIIAYDKNMHWIYPDLNSVLSKKFHFLWNGPDMERNEKENMVNMERGRLGAKGKGWTSHHNQKISSVTRQISLHIQRRIRVDVGYVFGVKTNPYLKIKYTFEIFHQPAVKL